MVATDRKPRHVSLEGRSHAFKPFKACRLRGNALVTIVGNHAELRRWR
jgi:hypothetical protein